MKQIGMTQFIVAIGCAVLLNVAVPAWADVDVNINVGVPPPIIVEAPPTMIFLGTPGIYVAIGVPYDIFFVSSRYFYFHGGNWFWAPGYGGPWAPLHLKRLPPGLQKYKIQQLREFREREYTVFKAQGPKFRGKHFIAVGGPGPKARHEIKENIKEKHK